MTVAAWRRSVATLPTLECETTAQQPAASHLDTTIKKNRPRHSTKAMKSISRKIICQFWESNLHERFGMRNNQQQPADSYLDTPGYNNQEKPRHSTKAMKIIYWKIICQFWDSNLYEIFRMWKNCSTANSQLPGHNNQENRPRHSTKAMKSIYRKIIYQFWYLNLHERFRMWNICSTANGQQPGHNNQENQA